MQLARRAKLRAIVPRRRDNVNATSVTTEEHDAQMSRCDGAKSSRRKPVEWQLLVALILLDSQNKLVGTPHCTEQADFNLHEEV
eukprot:6175245-Pleurochrysis_carterae.AAC.1